MLFKYFIFWLNSSSLSSRLYSHQERYGEWLLHIPKVDLCPLRPSHPWISRCWEVWDSSKWPIRSWLLNIFACMKRTPKRNTWFCRLSWLYQLLALWNKNRPSEKQKPRAKATCIWHYITQQLPRGNALLAAVELSQSTQHTARSPSPWCAGAGAAAAAAAAATYKPGAEGSYM